MHKINFNLLNDKLQKDIVDAIKKLVNKNQPHWVKSKAVFLNFNHKFQKYIGVSNECKLVDINENLTDIYALQTDEMIEVYEHLLDFKKIFEFTEFKPGNYYEFNFIKSIIEESCEHIEDNAIYTTGRGVLKIITDEGDVILFILTSIIEFDFYYTCLYNEFTNPKYLK